MAGPLPKQPGLRTRAKVAGAGLAAIAIFLIGFAAAGGFNGG